MGNRERGNELGEAEVNIYRVPNFLLFIGENFNQVFESSGDYLI